MRSGCQLGFIGTDLELDIGSTLGKACVFRAEPTCIFWALNCSLLGGWLSYLDIRL